MSYVLLPSWSFICSLPHSNYKKFSFFFFLGNSSLYFNFQYKVNLFCQAFKAFTRLYRNLNYVLTSSTSVQALENRRRILVWLKEHWIQFEREWGLSELALYIMVLKFLVNLVTLLNLHMYNAWHIFCLHKWQLLLLCGINEIFVIAK